MLMIAIVSMVVLTLWNYQIVNTSKQREAQLEQLVINELLIDHQLGKPSFKKSAVILNIVQKAFGPPPLSFEHHVVNFF